VRGTISEDRRVEKSPAAQPRYRYFEEAPESVTVPVTELLERIPQEWRTGADAGEGMLDLPCREVFAGNKPRLQLGVIRDLLPELVLVPEGTDPASTLFLPPGWLAMHFRMVTRREILPPDPGSAHVSAETEATGSSKEPSAQEPSEPPKDREPVAEVVVEPVIVSPEPTSVPAPKKEGVGKGEVPAEEKVAGEAPATGQKKGLFASLPMFRRRVAGEPSKETGTEAVGAASQGSPASGTANGEPRTEKALALEPLWKLDPQDQLADPSALQALFMTEEKLTLERIISKAGELPGLSACVLAHGDQVVCASKTADGVDLQTLSGHALTMLAQIRESSSKMGLGAVPAVTLHADQGVVSFLHKGELCLLVRHAARGFVPGVRERLQEMLGHLVEARPMLNGDSGTRKLET